MTIASLKTVYVMHSTGYGPGKYARSNMKKMFERDRVVFELVLVKSFKDIEKAISRLSQTRKDGKTEVGVFVMPDDVAERVAENLHAGTGAAHHDVLHGDRWGESEVAQRARRLWRAAAYHAAKRRHTTCARF